MSAFDYQILCTHRGCSRPAHYKIAARWSDGVTSELKTYALCCRDCVRPALEESRRRQSRCRLAAGESLERPGVYKLEAGKHDNELPRLLALE
jgi:hypothetical protein